jgi:hypothetical protein
MCRTNINFLSRLRKKGRRPAEPGSGQGKLPCVFSTGVVFDQLAFRVLHYLPALSCFAEFSLEPGERRRFFIFAHKGSEQASERWRLPQSAGILIMAAFFRTKIITDAHMLRKLMEQRAGITSALVIEAAV